MPFETNPWFLVITSWFLGRRPADYNGNMARGWESKSVEQQQEEATSRKENRKLPLTTEQIAEEQRRQGSCSSFRLLAIRGIGRCWKGRWRIWMRNLVVLAE
ncbi:MAG: hypothetical protein DMG97_07380 [Acidobacteria bacterium]|nr:MAG: hypothetical protein DMG97_07380 [Acidobacteriota bacterium]